jgi:hypothetical protein
MLDPEFKKKWVAALRSGEYEQGVGKLRSLDNKFCCLGVACDLVDPTQWSKMYELDYYYWGRYEWETLPNAVRSVISRYGQSINTSGLIHRNDISLWSFAQIADWIEENL